MLYPSSRSLVDDATVTIQGVAAGAASSSPSSVPPSQCGVSARVFVVVSVGMHVAEQATGIQHLVLKLGSRSGRVDSTAVRARCH